MKTAAIIAHVNRIPGCKVITHKLLDDGRTNMLIQQKTLGNVRLLLVSINLNKVVCYPAAGQHVITDLPRLWSLLGV